MYTAPSELLVAQPLSAPSTSLLGSYATASCRLRSEAVPADKYRGGGALAAVTAFYGRGEAVITMRLASLPGGCMRRACHDGWCSLSVCSGLQTHAMHQARRSDNLPCWVA